jgi:hypothetical protein
LFKGNSLSPLKLIVLFWISRLIYYTFFEGLLNTTPAKSLTNSFIVTSDNVRPNFKSRLLRPIIRLIPFEELSYLVKDKVIHDKWSRTELAGKIIQHRSIYFKVGCLTTIIIVLILLWRTFSVLNDHRQYLIEVKNYELEANELMTRLQELSYDRVKSNLNSRYIFRLEEIKANYDFEVGKEFNLLTEKITRDSILFSLFTANDTVFFISKDSCIIKSLNLPKFSISRPNLEQGVLLKYEQSFTGDTVNCGFLIPNQYRKVKLTSIKTVNEYISPMKKSEYGGN